MRIFLAILLASLGGVLPVHAFARPSVAVIDSGIAETIELRGRLIAEYDMASATPRAAFRPRYDHGTMVATILSRAAGGNVGIVSLRIDDPAGCPAGANPPCQSRPGPIAAAIRKAAALGVDAINISLSLQDHPAITAAVADAARQGILVVLAAGNEGRDHPSNLAMARAGFPNTILVGALDPAGKPWAGTNRPDAVVNGYSYTWRQGVEVPTVLANGRAVMGTGTSFAAPAATAELLKRRPEARAAAPAGGTGA